MGRQSKPEGKERSVNELTNEEIGHEMILFISASAYASIRKEDARLARYAETLKHIIDSREFNNQASIQWIIAVLTDETEVNKFINGVPSTNPFYRNRFAVRRLTRVLGFWIRAEIISDQNSLAGVLGTLNGRLEEHAGILGTNSFRGST